MPFCRRIFFFRGLPAILFPVFLGCISSVAQDIYRPLPTHSEASKPLIDGLREQYKQALERVDGPYKQAVRQVYLQRTNAMIKGVKAEVFIADAFVQERVDYIMHRLAHYNTLTNKPERILIQKHPMPNAMCFGEGTFLLTVGLLANLDNESQLAFAIAHELAHYELDHVKNRIVQNIESQFQRRTQQELDKILGGSGDEEAVSEVRNLVYTESRFKRDLELKADSLGFIFFRNAGYHEPEALTLLSALDSTGGKDMVGPDLFLAFHSDRFPFREHWLRRRLSVYGKTYDNTFFFSNDSLSSHPDIPLRKQLLGDLIGSSQQRLNYQDERDMRRLIRVSEFEAVESAYDLKQFDRTMYLALRMWDSNPNDSYLVAMISRVLIEMYNLKETDFFRFYVPRYTGHYNADLKRVNDFLNNLTRQDIGDLAYNFLNSEHHFDEENEEHYYLLWKLCDSLERRDVQKRVKLAYSQKFGKNKFDYQLR